MVEKEGRIGRFIHWIAPNAIWDLIKWIGGSSLMTSIGRIIWLRIHQSPIDWYFLGGLFLFGILLLLIAAWRQSRTSFGAPNEAQPVVPSNNSSRLKIISAQYGVEGIAEPDVTHYLSKRLRGNSFAELIVAELFDGYDPVSNVPKVLKVRYSFDGREFAISRPEYSWLILPEDKFLKDRLEELKGQLDRLSQESVSIAVNGKLVAGPAAFDEKRKIEGLLTPLQIEALAIAKEMRAFLNNFEPQPPPIDPRTQDAKTRLELMAKRASWRGKIWSAYELQFAERKRNLALQFGALGYTLNLSQFQDGRHEPVYVISKEADAITAMSHRIDGASLSVEV
jgi:hypothetical protein